METYPKLPIRLVGNSQLRYPDWSRVRTTTGYVNIKLPKDHWLYENTPMYKKYGKHTGWKPEHSLVMCLALGRPLHPGENVHHLNGIRDDNELANLELWTRPQPSGVRVADLRHCKGCRCPTEMGPPPR